MIKKYFILLALVLGASTAIADNGRCNKLGVSYLAQAKFTPEQCTQALSAYDADISLPVFPFLWSTFGNNYDCALRFVSEKASQTVVWHIYGTNETCRRAPRHCAAGEIQPSKRFWQVNYDLEHNTPDGRRYIRALKVRVIQILEFFKAYRNPDTELILSTGLEDNFSPKAFAKILKVYRGAIQDARYNSIRIYIGLSRNPVGNSYSASAMHGLDFIELHGVDVNFPKQTACIYSNDGIDLFTDGPRQPLTGAIPASDLLTEIERHPDCISYVWWNAQGITTKFKEPRARNIRLYPEDINLANKIFKEILK